MKTTAQRVLMSTKAKSEAPKEAEDNKLEGANKPVSEQDAKESENEQKVGKQQTVDLKLEKHESLNKCSKDSDDLPGWNFDISNLIEGSDDEEKEKIPAGEPLKACVFDFDQTISVIHFYCLLRGYNPDMQLRCLKDWSDEKVVQGFGGKERVLLLENLFKDLKKASVELYILSFGHKEVILKALERVNLALYFDKDLIWGEAEVKQFRTDTGIASHPKLRMIQKLIRDKHKYSAGEVLFVDDDEKNLAQSKRTVCKTIHVFERKGMTEKEIEAVRSEINPS